MNDENVLLERAFGTSFARALNWCVEIPGYTPTTPTADDHLPDPENMVLDDTDDEDRTTEYLTEDEFFAHLKRHILGE